MGKFRVRRATVLGASRRVLHGHLQNLESVAGARIHTRSPVGAFLFHDRVQMVDIPEETTP